MVTREEIDAIYVSKAEGEVRKKRENLRGTFKGEDRPEYLKNLIMNGNFFTKTKPGDVVADAERNYVIGIMDEMGFLDEENLLRVVRYMLYELPVLPDRAEKELAGHFHGQGGIDG